MHCEKINFHNAFIQDKLLGEEFVISDVTVINHVSRVCGPKLIRFDKQKQRLFVKKDM